MPLDRGTQRQSATLSQQNRRSANARACREPLAELRPASPARSVADGDGDRFLLADQNDEAFASGDARVEKVALQHRVVLRENRDDHGGIFGPLALADSRGVGRNQNVELAESVSDCPPVEAHRDFAGLRVDVADIANVAVVDLLVIVVLDLHDLVPRGKGPAEALDFPLAGRIENGLELDVERASADPAAVHRAENLDVPDGIEPEPFGDAGLDQLQYSRDRRFRIIRWREIEIAIAGWRSQLRHIALVDPMGVDDDPA